MGQGAALNTPSRKIHGPLLFLEKRNAGLDVCHTMLMVAMQVMILVLVIRTGIIMGMDLCCIVRLVIMIMGRQRHTIFPGSGQQVTGMVFGANFYGTQRRPMGVSLMGNFQQQAAFAGFVHGDRCFEDAVLEAGCFNQSFQPVTGAENNTNRIRPRYGLERFYIRQVNQRMKRFARNRQIQLGKDFQFFRPDCQRH